MPFICVRTFYSCLDITLLYSTDSTVFFSWIFRLLWSFTCANKNGFCSSLHLANGHPKSNNNSTHWPLGFPNCYWRMMVRGWVFGLNTRSFSEGIELTKLNQKIMDKWLVVLVCSQNIVFESWILPLNLGVELHLEIQAQPFSTKHLLKKKHLTCLACFPTEMTTVSDEKTASNPAFRSCREPSTWSQAVIWNRASMKIGKFSELRETHQMFHKVFSASSFQIKNTSLQV